MEKICPYCNKNILYEHWREFACHCASCTYNVNVRNKYKKSRNTWNKRYIKKYKLKCIICGKNYELKLTKYKFNNQKYRKTCSTKCAHKRILSENTKSKISMSLRKNKIFICKQCNKKIILNRTKNSKYCSNKCKEEAKVKRMKIRRNNALQSKKGIKKYRLKCKFMFNVYDYPNKFDLKLIDKYGWYHPVNNPNGVDRDHKISISYGFKNNIDPKIISHIENCELKLHKDNLSKGQNSDLLIEELLNKIKNSKYKKNTNI